MNTETKLMASVQQCDELIEELQRAKREARQGSTTSYARVVLEQMTDRGPWRLVIGVTSD